MAAIDASAGGVVSLVEQVRLGALAHSDDLVLKHVDGRQLSYAELWDAANDGARALAGLGVGPGDRVATFLDDYFASFVNWMAIGLLRAVEVPVNPVLRTASLLHPLDDATPVAVLTTSSLLPHLEALSEQPRRRAARGGRRRRHATAVRRPARRAGRAGRWGQGGRTDRGAAAVGAGLHHLHVGHHRAAQGCESSRGV